MDEDEEKGFQEAILNKMFGVAEVIRATCSSSKVPPITLADKFFCWKCVYKYNRISKQTRT